jgi:hypothetical protein
MILLLCYLDVQKYGGLAKLYFEESSEELSMSMVNKYYEKISFPSSIINYSNVIINLNYFVKAERKR